MTILQTKGWKEYELFDSGNGRRLEKFGAYVLSRPDPQAIWRPTLPQSRWESADASFIKQNGREQWVLMRRIPEKWKMQYKSISFFAKLTPFKHTGVFPEQHVMWDWMEQRVQSAKGKVQSEDGKLRILNLFGYTGIASLVCAAAGAEVTHVDASYPTIGWARENQQISNLTDKPIRWIQDDCTKFVMRELKRGNRYDGILMDPPVYGHGPKGETWDFHKDFPKLLDLSMQVLTKKPLFILINAYAVSASALMLENILNDHTKRLLGSVEAGELALQESSSPRLLSTGIFARWS